MMGSAHNASVWSESSETRVELYLIHKEYDLLVAENILSVKT